MLSSEVLRRLYPEADPATIETFAHKADELWNEFELSANRNRVHFFLAQLGHESGGRAREENLNYSAKRMMAVWPGRFPNLASTSGLANNPQALANSVYGGRMGNVRPDDGWRYRGRGYIQITGRDGYAQVGSLAKLDLVGDPDLALAPQTCLRVACAFWAWKKLNPKCDAGDFVTVTRLINGGTLGLQDRFAWLEKVQAIVPWPASTEAKRAVEPDLSLASLKAIQLKLRSLGLYEGSIDGVFGRGSRDALKVFQADQGLAKTGRLDQATIDRLAT
jgi:putative chitinase